MSIPFLNVNDSRCSKFSLVECGTVTDLKNTIKISETKMEKHEYNSLINNQVSCAINWCKKYNVKINENSIYYKKNV